MKPVESDDELGISVDGDWMDVKKAEDDSSWLDVWGASVLVVIYIVEDREEYAGSVVD